MSLRTAFFIAVFTGVAAGAAAGRLRKKSPNQIGLFGSRDMQNP